jgi:hypothetical protein
MGLARGDRLEGARHRRGRRLDEHLSYFFERLLSEDSDCRAMDLAHKLSFQPRAALQPSLQLRLQDAIFGAQIFEARQQFVVHRPCDEGENARPI